MNNFTIDLKLHFWSRVQSCLKNLTNLFGPPPPRGVVVQLSYKCCLQADNGDPSEFLVYRNKKKRHKWAQHVNLYNLLQHKITYTVNCLREKYLPELH